MPRVLLAALLVLTAGCFRVEPQTPAVEETGGSETAPVPTPGQPITPTVPTPDGAPAPCLHPYPCRDGGEWPQGLAGPFPVSGPENVTVTTLDGTRLRGVLFRPLVPEGVRVPVVVEASPYPGQTAPPAWHPAYRAAAHDAGYAFDELLAAGVAVAIFNVRGTGESGGCFDFWGRAEQEDNVALVEWAAAQPWSNGRVGMYGLSYMGTTPWQAAIRAPPALKTIVVAGILTDKYLAAFTPQGAAWFGAGPFALGAGSALGYVPPARAGAAALLAEVTGGPRCPDTAGKLAEHQRSALVDDRHAEWYEERRLARHLSNVTAAVLVTAGYADGAVHTYQEDTIWPALTRAPRHMVLGHWGHEFPTDVTGSPSGDDFRAYQIAWFDYWLKGVGDLPVGTGAVHYESAPGAWRASPSWPPAEGRLEALHLVAGGLGRAGEGTATFRAAPGPISPESMLCAWLASGDPGPAGLAYVSEPLAQPVELAGNAMALLRVRSDQAGGSIALSLLRVPTEEECRDLPNARLLFTSAAADLRFHGGGYQGRDFPVGTEQAVRLDLWNTGTALAAGERLAVVVHRAYPLLHDAAPRWSPTFTLSEGTSHVVLPLVAGTLGGSAPVADYPPRPFAAG